MKKLSLLLIALLLLSAKLIAFEPEKKADPHQYRPGDHNLLSMPTAYTMPKDTLYFSDYELILVNFNTALTSQTQLGCFSVIPINFGLIRTLTLEIKQNYLHTKNYQSSVWALYAPIISKAAVGNIVSIGAPNTSLHLGAGGYRNFDDDKMALIYMVGINYDLSKRTSFMCEASNYSSFIEDFADGLFNIGIRIRTKKLAWDLGGIHSFGQSGGFVLFPFIKITVLFLNI